MYGNTLHGDTVRSSGAITAEYLAQHPRSFDVKLKDGRRVRIRPLVPQDRPAIAAGVDRMSDRSRYYRFHRAVARLTDAELDQLADVDQHRHVAWGALAVDEPGRPGIGVARFVREAGDPTRAQLAIGIVDDYHDAGLGKILLQTLMVTAAEVGVETLVAEVLPDNFAALRLFKREGAELVGGCEGACRLEIPVSSPRRTYRWSTQIVSPEERDTA